MGKRSIRKSDGWPLQYRTAGEKFAIFRGGLAWEVRTPSYNGTSYGVLCHTFEECIWAASEWLRRAPTAKEMRKSYKHYLRAHEVMHEISREVWGRERQIARG